LIALDPRTLIFCVSISLLLMSTVFLFEAKSFPDSIRGPREWGAACLVNFVSAVLFGLRGSIPDFLSLVVSVVAVQSSFALFLTGVRVFYGVPRRSRPLVAIIAFNAPLVWFFSFASPSFIARSILFCGVIGAFLGASLWTMGRAMLARRPRYAEIFTFASLFVLCGVCVVRGMHALWAGVSTVELPAAAPIQVAYLAVFEFSYLATNIGVILMAHDRLHDEQQRLLREQTRAVEELRLAEDKFGKVFHASPIPVCFSEVAEGRYLDVNEAYARVFGWSREEAVGRTTGELQVWESPEERARWLDAIREGHGRRDFQAGMRHRSGRPLSVLISSEWVNIGGKDYVMSIVFDITERVHAESQLRNLNLELERRVEDRTAEVKKAMAELESFSYSVSHDLRAPLRAISGFVSLIEENEAQQLSELGRGRLATVKRNAHKMAELIDALLGFAQLTRMGLAREDIDMHEIANAVAGEQRENFPLAAIAVDPLPAARGDPAMIRQVLVNLVDNALKYSSKTPSPQVRVGWSEADAAWFVRDNGAGFDMKYSRQLFGTFQRLHTETDFPGTGIGLASVKRIVERHGGRVWATGEQGKGACFYFTLG
jgi:PAS domain S-box-containing protein